MKNKQLFSSNPLAQTLKADRFEKSISFTGLSDDLGKKLYDDESDISQVSLKNPKSRNIVGNLPPSWIDKIPPRERKEKIQRLYSQLNKIPEILRKADFTPKSEIKAEEKLTNAYREAGIIAKKDKISITDLGSGSSGYGYLIEGLPEKYVMKVYHDYNGYNKHAGQYIEMNNAMYWKKNAGSDTQRAEFFFGDIQSGYMMTKYIDADSKPPKKIVNPLLLGIAPKEDLDNNKIGEHYIDYGYLDRYGLVEYKSKFIELQGLLSESKNARFAYKQVYKARNKDQIWQEIYEDRRHQHKDGIKVGLVLALDFLDNPSEKYMKAYKYSNEAQSSKDIDLLKKALAQKIEYAPKENFQDCCSQLIKSEKEVIKILKNKIVYTEDEKLQEEIKKAITNYYSGLAPQ